VDTVELANATRWASFWERIENGAFFVVVVALAIEFAALKFGAPYKAKIDHDREVRIAGANERAANAELALELYKAPRDLTPGQQASMSDALKPFAGMRFAGMTASSVPDSRPLWMKLSKTLESAGWIREAPSGLALGDPPAGVSVSPNEGITIFVPAEDWNDLLPSVQALYNSLTAIGLKTVAVPDRGEQKRPHIIVIEIGTKPQ